MCSIGMIDYYLYLVRRLFAMDNNKNDSFSYDDFDKAHGLSLHNDATIELYETHKIDWAHQKSAQIPPFLRKVETTSCCSCLLLIASTS
jgi:hypothetical protein